jgi:hypothetical protein
LNIVYLMIHGEIKGKLPSKSGGYETSLRGWGTPFNSTWMEGKAHLVKPGREAPSAA